MSKPGNMRANYTRSAAQFTTGADSAARSAARIVGGLSLLAFPLMFMLVFLLHVESPGELFDFRLRHEAYTAADILVMLADPVRSQRYYVLPHLLGYLSMPVLTAAGITLGLLLYPRKPWFALIGAAMTCLGALFMGGMLAIWASFAPLGTLPAADASAAEAALASLIAMQGVLLYSTILAGLSLLGLMVLAIGLYRGGIVPMRSTALIATGSVIMSIFIDVDNLMFIGAFMALLGMAPIGWRLIRGGEPC